jgi:TAT (twin-arginine translocation) pathway-exported protein
MNTQSHPRRTFIKTSAAAVAAMALPLSSRGGEQSASQKAWPIGCHARPFGKFRLNHDDLLDAIKSAGYISADMISAAPPAARGAAPAGGTTPAPAQRGPAAVTPEMVTALKEKLAARGMVSTVCSLSIGTDVPLADAVAAARQPGKVDFAGMFKKLKSYGFNGPIFVEGTAVGETLEQTIANARANREFLEKARTT